MNYYISDTHFGHENIINHDANNGCKQFSSIEEHDNLIIENWNRVVTPQDNIYILGDFSWLYARETEELIKKLNGAKFLIKGNHDRWCKDGACKKLFQGIYDYKTIQDGGKMVVMSHYPIAFWNHQHHYRRDGNEHKVWAVQLYGHVHASKEEDIFQEFIRELNEKHDIKCIAKNVGCMHWDYTPVTLKQILEKQKENN